MNKVAAAVVTNHSPTVPIPLLIGLQTHVSTATAQSMDFQSRVGFPIQDGTVSECLVVFTRAADGEMDELSLRMAANGISMVRIDSDRCLSADLSWHPLENKLRWEGHEFRPILSWRRYFDIDAMAAGPDEVVAKHVREQWASFATAMTRMTRSINCSATPDRITQLAVAKAHGLRVPRTVLTSNPRDLDEFGADLLVKSLGRHMVEPTPGQLHGVYPKHLSRKEFGHQIDPAPMLVQEFVHAERELRVYIVGDQLISYAVTRPDPESLWLAPDLIAIEPCVLPAELAAALRRLHRHWGLDVAAYDLLDAQDGAVFLEVNTECDWRWADSGANTNQTSIAVSELIAELVTKKASDK